MNHLGYWLRLVQQQDAQALDKKLKAVDIQIAEYFSLRLLQEKGEMLSSQLADELRMTRGALSKILDRLEKKEFLTKKSSRSDLRLQPILLSKKGLKILEELDALVEAHEEEFFGSLSKVQLSVLHSVLQRLAEKHRPS